MDNPDTLAPLLHALKGLTTWFEADQVPGVVIGGVAASLLGRPRVTQDIDALVQIDEERWAKFLSQGTRYKFLPRIRDPLEFARKARVLLLRHEPTQIDVDIAFATLPFEEESISNASKIQVQGVTLSIWIHKYADVLELTFFYMIPKFRHIHSLSCGGMICREGVLTRLFSLRRNVAG